MAHAYPPFDLVIRTPLVELRGATDDLLEELVPVIDAGIYDPSAPPPFDDPMSLMVFFGGRPIGMWDLTGVSFRTMRTVATFSWLGLPNHGKGIGREMRSAVLHLAFEGLGAHRAESEAFEDNHASNRVSLALGYRPNGTGWGIRKGAAAPMARYLLTRDRWLERRRDGINISGLEPCRVMLGSVVPELSAQAPIADARVAWRHRPRAGKMCGVTKLIVITGPIGAGKSSVAQGLAKRFHSAGCSVACVDLDDVVETLSAPLQDFETSWRRARRVHGVLIGAWLRSGIDAVIAHGPFYTAEERAALLAEVPPTQEQCCVMLLVPFEVAFERIKDDSDRFWSKDRDFLRRTHERFTELLSEVPRCEWNFDTTQMSADEIVSALAASLVRDRAVDKK